MTLRTIDVFVWFIVTKFNQTSVFSIVGQALETNYLLKLDNFLAKTPISVSEVILDWYQRELKHGLKKDIVSDFRVPKKNHKGTPSPLYANARLVFFSNFALKFTCYSFKFLQKK